MLRKSPGGGLLGDIGQVGSAWALAALPGGIRLLHTCGSQAVGCLGAGLGSRALHTPLPTQPPLADPSPALEKNYNRVSDHAAVISD